ncbi:MAG: hypothetical protein COV44_00985 [Deltaproteobacteria bacterium CG11_big_fil_rev_8_21_14_0_20_45_16]|nr:MAG: hypothetical protein COV44_00985 [Deltaproteobacteria bacterium CG11_big_fil_rev_8_21_14_0_20_45_16]
MRVSNWLALSVLFLSLVAMSLNIWTGWQLSGIESPGALTERHFLQALALVGGILGGNIWLFSLSQKRIENSLSDENIARRLIKVRRQTFPWALISMMLCLISLITGSIAHPGSFPFLHGILGFSVLGSSIVSFVNWLRFSLL